MSGIVHMVHFAWIRWYSFFLDNVTDEVPICYICRYPHWAFPHNWDSIIWSCNGPSFTEFSCAWRGTFDEDSAGLRPDLEAETSRRLWSLDTQVLVFIYLRQCGADEETGAESDASFTTTRKYCSHLKLAFIIDTVLHTVSCRSTGRKLFVLFLCTGDLCC